MYFLGMIYDVLLQVQANNVMFHSNSVVKYFQNKYHYELGLGLILKLTYEDIQSVESDRNSPACPAGAEGRPVTKTAYK